MADYGLTVTRKEEMVRLTLRCPHQNGVLYVVRGEKIVGAHELITDRELERLWALAAPDPGRAPEAQG